MKPAASQDATRREAFYLKLAMLALAVVIPMILFAPSLFGGKMLWGGDIETLEMPFSISARRNLAIGELPLWMPELLGGMPGIAATNLVFLYPSEILIHLLKIPVTQGFALDAALQVALAGLGMLFFCRRLGASLQASFLAAFAFALSGSQISILFAGHINNIKAIAMIPWAFWAAHKAMSERCFFAWGLCGLALALQMLGIGMQIFAYTAIGLAAFAAWWAYMAEHSGATRLKANPWIFACAGLGLSMFVMFLISAPQLWLSLQYKPYSWREGFGYEQFISWSFHPKESLGWIVPGFYGWREPTYHGDWPFCLSSEYFGILPWVLGSAAVAALWKLRHGWARFFLGFALLSFLIALGKWTPLHLIFYHLPVYSGFRTWARFLTLFTFSICTLSALGWDALFSETNRSWAVKGALAFCALALLAAFICFGVSDTEASVAAPVLASKLGGVDAAKLQTLDLIRTSAGKAVLLAICFAVLFWFTPRRKMVGLAFVLALGLQAWDISDLSSRYVTFRDSSDFLTRPSFLNVLPDPDASAEPFRILDTPGVWNQNAGIIYGYESLLGYHGVELAVPMKLQQAMQNRQMDWLNMMNVRYVLSREAISGLPLLADGAVKVYSNLSAMPRAWLVRSVLSASTEDGQYKLLGSPAFHPAQEVILGHAMNFGAPMAGSPGLVRWTQRKRNSFDLAVDAAQDCVLVVSQNWYPAWRCEVDGHPTEIMQADGGLQAVALSGGSHTLHFYYSAALLVWASMASALGLGFLACLGWVKRRGAVWA